MENKNKITTSEFLDKLSLNMTLNLFKTGSGRVNFKILKMLPTTTQHLQQVTKLTKMPINKRLNELENAGLLKRQRYKGKVEKTKLTSKFFKCYSKMNKLIIDNPNIKIEYTFN